MTIMGMMPRLACLTQLMIALAALIVDEMEKSLISSFDLALNPLLEILYQSC